jgi:hypothetical protein
MSWNYYIEGREVYPVNSRNHALEYSKEAGDEFLRPEMGKVTIIDNASEGINDYTWFMQTIENNPDYKNYNKRISFQVKRQSDDETIYDGEFKRQDVNYDKNKHILKIKLLKVDKYTEFKENKDLKINVLNQNKYIIRNFIKTNLVFASNIGESASGYFIYITFGSLFLNSPVIMAREEVVIPNIGITFAGWTLDEELSTDLMAVYYRNWNTNYTSNTSYIKYSDDYGGGFPDYSSDPLYKYIGKYAYVLNYRIR